MEATGIQKAPRGFLLLDQEKNTVMIPAGDLDALLDLIGIDRSTFRKRLCTVNQHKTKAELDRDISSYLKGEYWERMPE